VLYTGRPEDTDLIQTVVERLFDNLNGLSKLKENGYGVGQLKWKPPRKFRSFTYSQSGFKLDKKGGQTVLSLSKLADIPIRLHRALPDDTTLKQVTVKKEPTGEWFATFGVQIDREPPETPRIPRRASESTRGFSSMPTTRMEPPWGRSISPSSVTAGARATEALTQATRVEQLREATTARREVSR